MIYSMKPFRDILQSGFPAHRHNVYSTSSTPDDLDNHPGSQVAVEELPMPVLNLTSKARVTVLIAVLAVVVVTIGIVIASVLGNTRGTAAPAASTSTAGVQVPPAPTSTSTTPASVPPPVGTVIPTASADPASADAQKQVAATGATGFIDMSASVLLSSNAPNTVDLAAVATGSAYDGILSSFAEFDNNGWHQVGQPVIVDTRVISYDEQTSPDTMILGVCVDSSPVNVVTTEGTVVRAGTSADRALNVLTMTRNADGAWLVSKLSFPDNPNC